MAVNNIIEAVERVYKANNQSNSSSSSLEFHVFFNDHYNNDFNTLFRSSSYASKSYYAAGVAGSFYGRLFPKSTLHFVHCSCALPWMSQVPKEVVDKKSPAWNGNRIHYTTSTEKVHEAYAAQFKKDIECFLSARAHEIVEGGLMLLVVPAQPTHCIASQISHAAFCRPLESCLSEMVKLGDISEEKLDAFNLPVYFPTSKEMEAIIKENENFEIERMSILNSRKNLIKLTVEMYVGMIRAALEAVFKQHFGDEVIPELVQRFSDKVAQNPDMLESNSRSLQEFLFVVLKRK